MNQLDDVHSVEASQEEKEVQKGGLCKQARRPRGDAYHNRVEVSEEALLEETSRGRQKDS